MKKDVVSYQEASEILNISRRTVYNLVKKGVLLIDGDSHCKKMIYTESLQNYKRTKSNRTFSKKAKLKIDEKGLLTVKQVADILNIVKSTVLGYCKQGIFDSEIIEGKRMIYSDSLKDYENYRCKSKFSDECIPHEESDTSITDVEQSDENAYKLEDRYGNKSVSSLGIPKLEETVTDDLFIEDDETEEEEIMTIADLKKMIEELDDDMPLTIQTYDKETKEISGCKFVESANILENKEEEDCFQKVLCLNDTLHKNLSKITAETNAFVINQLFPTKIEYVNTLGQYRDNGILRRFPYGYKLVDYKTGEALDIKSYDDEKKYVDCNVVYMAPSCDDNRMSIHLEVL